MPDGAAHSVVKSAKRVIAAMEEFYADFGESVHDCLAFQRRKFDEPETRYAWKIREIFGRGFVARGLQLARQLFQRANGAFPTVVPKDGAGRLMPELFSGWEV